MTPLSEIERGEIAQALLARKFGDLLEWTQPDLIHRYSTNDLKYVEDYSTKLQATIEETRSTLLSLSDEELRQAEVDLANDDTEPIAAWYEISLQKIRKLRNHNPPAIAFGLGHPKFDVDLDYWCALPDFSLKEAVFLSVGASPEAVTDRQFEKLLAHKNNDKKLWSAHEFLLRRYELFSRYFPSTAWGRPNQASQYVLGWINEYQLDVYPPFLAKLEARFGRPTNPKPKPNIDKLSAQERATLLKIIAAMACEQYAYDPKEGRSSVPSNLQADLLKIGQSLDGKTIRKWLKEAVCYVDEDYWANP